MSPGVKQSSQAHSLKLIAVDLLERFRNLVFLQTQAVAQKMALELTQNQYKISVMSFAKDVRLACSHYEKNPAFWVEAGLISSPEDLEALIDCIDEVLVDTEVIECSIEKVYATHGRLLSFLGHLQGIVPACLPGARNVAKVRSDDHVSVSDGSSDDMYTSE